LGPAVRCYIARERGRPWGFWEMTSLARTASYDGAPGAAAPAALHPQRARAFAGLESRTRILHRRHSPEKQRSQNGYGEGPEFPPPQQTQFSTVYFNFFTPLHVGITLDEDGEYRSACCSNLSAAMG